MKSNVLVVAERDERLIRKLVSIFPIFRAIFRIRFHDTEKIPERAALFIANHNIGAVIEIFALLYAWEQRFGFKFSRPIYGLGHRFSFQIPGLSTLVRKLGSVPAEHEEANRVLLRGNSLIIFPGGVWEAARPFSQRHLTDFKNRRGWIQIAKRAQVPIIPISISGSHALNPVLFRSRWLARIFGIDRLFGIKYFPFSIGQVLWSALFVVVTRGHVSPWVQLLGAVILFVETPLIPIWPGRISISFEDPVDSRLPEDEIYRIVEERIASRLGTNQK